VPGIFQKKCRQKRSKRSQECAGGGSYGEIKEKGAPSKVKGEKEGQKIRSMRRKGFDENGFDFWENHGRVWGRD